MAELYRLGVSSETKTKILPTLDQKKFLRLNEEDRAELYCFATALCARNGIPPKKAVCESFVMDKSVRDQTMATLLLTFFMTQKDIEKSIDKVGLKQRKELVNEGLNPMSNSGFSAIKEMMSKPEDVIIVKLINEMDEMYAEAAGIDAGLNLPVAKPFEN